MHEQPPKGKDEKDDARKPTEDDLRYVEEVRFIEKKGREPDMIDEMEKDPRNVVEHLASDLDLHTHSAANILTLLELVDKKGVPIDKAKVEAILDKFKFDGEHATTLHAIKADLMKLQWYLREQVGNETYFNEALPQTESLEQRLKKNSKFILTAGEEGEPLG